MIVQTGLDVLLAGGAPELRGAKIGLVTNPTGVDTKLVRSATRLAASNVVKVAALFGPEHGILGDAQAGAHVPPAIDRELGVPVYSLYGETRRPKAEMLVGLDAIVVDVQDIGIRYATYFSTLIEVQLAAAEAGVPVAVLDRPNPINGRDVAGNLAERDFLSFVGAHEIVIRHGMTLGELARLVAAERGLPAPIVVPMRGWRRAMWFDQTGLPWVLPSPNLPTLDSLTLYGGTCLIEATTLSEGRGTTRPFEVAGSPSVDAEALTANLRARGCPGVAFRPMVFTPTISKHAGKPCYGVQLHITDRGVLDPVRLGIELLAAVREVDPKFAWRKGEDGQFFLDQLLGSDKPRRAFDAGERPEQIVASWRAMAAAFRERRRPFLLYPEDDA